MRTSGHRATRGGRRPHLGVAVVVALVVLALLPGCSWQRVGPTGATTGTGVNSSFTDAGVELVIERGEATLDFRGDQLTAADLGASEGEALRDVDVRDGDGPIRVTVKGSGGRPRRRRGGHPGPRVSRGPARAGQADVERSPAAQRPVDHRMAQRGLGFAVGLHPILEEPGDVPLLEYALTAPGQDLGD